MKSLYLIYKKLIEKFQSVILYFKLHFFKVIIGEHWKIKGSIFIRNSGAGGITIGTNFKGNSGISKNPIGAGTILRLITKKSGKIVIKDNVGISNSTLYSENSILIESDVLIGGGCCVWDTDFHSLDKDIRGTALDEGKTQPVIIKKKAFIGANCTILKGVTIGENAIVATGSVVAKTIPDNQLWGGNPARFIRDI